MSVYHGYDGYKRDPEWRKVEEALLEGRITDEQYETLALIVRGAMAQGWDERSKAKPQYLGPFSGHWADCMGWEDCWCASYPNPYRGQPASDEGAKS